MHGNYLKRNKKVANLLQKANTKKQIAEKSNITKSFWHLRTFKNPDYLMGLKEVGIRSCLLHNNVNTTSWQIKTKPKWVTDLLQSELDKETGEILGQSVYTTDDLKSGNYRKIKALNNFCDVFQPMYKRRKCSIFFYTLTLANQSRTDVRGALNTLKTRLKRKGVNLKGYVWVLEISDKLHVHYHALICTDRINIKGKSIPAFLKMNDVWGCRTQVAFAESHVRNYLAKYFTKNSARIIGKRSYGLSIKKEYKKQ